MASEETASSGPRTPDASTAAVYVRSNSAHDRAVQLATCLADAEQRGLTVDEPHIFIEVTDASDQWYDRPELALMHQAMVRGEFAVLVVASGHVLFGSSQDLDGFTRLMSNFGVKLLVVSPHATAELGPLARDWIIKNLAHGDEQTYERAAETVRRTTQFLATTAVASLNSLLAPHPQGDRSAVPLGPTTPAPRAPAPAGQAAYRPPSDRGPQSARPPSGIPELPETAQAYGAPSPISAQLTARAKQGVQALVADHVAHVTNRTANQDTGYLNRSAGRRVRRAYAFRNYSGPPSHG